MTLTLLQARDALIGYVDAHWKLGPPTAALPLHYDNVKLDKSGRVRKFHLSNVTEVS